MSKIFIILAPTIIAILIRLKPFDLLLRTFNTLTHELSHAFIAILFRQKVQKIALNTDFSGVCVTKITSKVAGFFISLAGYTLPGLIGFGLICLIPFGITEKTFYIIMAISIISIIFAIANSFGRVWTICFASLNLIFILVPIFHSIYDNIIYIYAYVLLIENLLSTLTLLYVNLINPKKAGDSLLLKKTTHIPTIIWSILFFVFSVVMLCLSFVIVAKYFTIL